MSTSVRGAESLRDRSDGDECERGGWIEGQSCMGGWLGGWMGGLMVGCLVDWLRGWLAGWMVGWLDWWVDGWVGARVGGWIDDLCILARSDMTFNSWVFG